VDAELQTVRVTEGLTEDAVYARLYRGGLAPPLFLHTPLAGATTDRRLSQAITEVERIERMRSVFKVQVITLSINPPLGTFLLDEFTNGYILGLLNLICNL
jgi:hypothetical protein